MDKFLSSVFHMLDICTVSIEIQNSNIKIVNTFSNISTFKGIFFFQFRIIHVKTRFEVIQCLFVILLTIQISFKYFSSWMQIFFDVADANKIFSIYLTLIHFKILKKLVRKNLYLNKSIY